MQRNKDIPLITPMNLSVSDIWRSTLKLHYKANSFSLPSKRGGVVVKEKEIEDSISSLLVLVAAGLFHGAITLKDQTSAV